jgi:hypothetical protein
VYDAYVVMSGDIASEKWYEGGVDLDGGDVGACLCKCKCQRSEACTNFDDVVTGADA